MENVSEFWHLLERNGYCIAEPRPRLDPALEGVIEEELADEERFGQKEPETMPSLSGNVRLVSKGDSRFLLYAVATRFEQGLWGVGVNEVAELKVQPLT